MTGRTVAEVVADLRDDWVSWGREALDLLESLDGLRLPCPTCDGTAEIVVGHMDGGGERVACPCPDCVDGRMSHERAWAIVAAVFGDPRDIQSSGGYRDAILNLRSVLP